MRVDDALKILGDLFIFSNAYDTKDYFLLANSSFLFPLSLSVHLLFSIGNPGVGVVVHLPKPLVTSTRPRPSIRWLARCNCLGNNRSKSNEYEQSVLTQYV